jgi:GT2 family glycosyltransferase
MPTTEAHHELDDRDRRGDHTAAITVAVVTRDRAELFARYAVDDLKVAARNGFAVIVVDQSRDGRTRRLIDGVGGVTYLRTGPGLSRGRNAAVEATRTPLLAFTDDDVTIPPGWLPRMAELLEQEVGAGAACGPALQGSRLVVRPRPGVHRWPSNPFGLGGGLNIAFRREALEEVGPFDEELGAGGRYRSAEDADMLYRLLRAGWTVVCSNDVGVVHNVWRSRVENARVLYGYGVGIGAQTHKHWSAGDREALDFALATGRENGRDFARSLLRLRVRAAAGYGLIIAGGVRGFEARARAHRRERSGYRAFAARLRRGKRSTAPP